MSSRHKSHPYPQVHCFDTSFDKCFVLFLLFVCLDRSTLCIPIYKVGSWHLTIKLDLPVRVQGSHFSHIFITNLLQQLKLLGLLYKLFVGHNQRHELLLCVHFSPDLHARLACMNVRRNLTVNFFKLLDFILNLWYCCCMNMKYL